MEITNQLYICFGIPLMGLFLYYKLFDKVEDNTIFYIGFLSTINFFLWFSEIFTIRYWGMSAFNILGFLYLLILAPILSIGFSYWLFIRRKTLTRYYYSLITSVGYVLIVWGLPFFLLIFVIVFKNFLSIP